MITLGDQQVLHLGQFVVLIQNNSGSPNIQPEVRWAVPSQQIDGDDHRVYYLPFQNVWGCDCRGYLFRHRKQPDFKCRHIFAVIAHMLHLKPDPCLTEKEEGITN